MKANLDKYNQILTRVSLLLELPTELVDKAYKGFWASIRDAIETLPLKEDLSEEEFSELLTSFNIPSIGKIHCSYTRLLGVKNRFKYLQKLRENAENKEDKANV